MPKDIKSTNSAETEKVTDRTAEQRAADQDTAVENAFVEGTLPEEDRRTTAPNVAPLIADPTTRPTDRAIPAGQRPFIGPDGTLHRADGSTKREEHGVGRLLQKMPPNSRVIWSNEREPAGIWRVELGPGTNKSVGEGETLRRAWRMVGAKMGRHPEDSQRQVMLDEHERPIHPHLDTDPDDPTDPTQKPKIVNEKGDVVDAPEPESPQPVVENEEEADDDKATKTKSKAKK